MCHVHAAQVCTAQYFVWWLSLLPLSLPHIRWPPPKGLLLAGVLWGAAQLHWLGWAYLLEFKVRLGQGHATWHGIPNSDEDLQACLFITLRCHVQTRWLLCTPMPVARMLFVHTRRASQCT